MKRIMLALLAATLLVTGCKHKESVPVARNIYPEPAAAQADLAKALATAASTHKRVLIDFGGNWCGDCKALDFYFHQPTNQALLEANYVLVDVNIGHMDANLDIARKYDVPLDKGVPALAVLDEHGQLIFSQRNGQFESMRTMQPEAVRAFLDQWKPTTPCSTEKVTC